MFDNILSQERAVKALSHDIEGDCLPQALLFHGPDLAGKLSAALELARVLSCQASGAPWSCACGSCVQHKNLLSPYLMILGQRYFRREVRACGTAVLADCREGTRFLLVRSLRKLLKRFDPILMEGESKFPAAVKLIEKLEEKLDPFLPDRPALAPHEIAENLEELYKLADSLVDLLPQDGLSINMIRRVTYWVHTADANQPKFVIIENAELMNESTRNSLLKVLEEPPARVWFILLTAQKSAIMPTILSRVRPYAFVDRGLAEQQVLERIFRQASGAWPNLRGFFAAQQPGGLEQVQAQARGLSEALLRRAGLGAALGPGRAPELAELLAALGKDRSVAEDLVRNTMAELAAWLPRFDQPETAARLAAAGLSPLRATDILQALMRRLQYLYGTGLSYNLAPTVMVERLWFESGTGD